MSLLDKIREEKNLYSIWPILGQSSTRRKLICPLPFHQHKAFTPSFAVHLTERGERWRCFGSCNLEGDVVDLVGYLRVPGYDPKNLKMLEKAWSMLDGNYQIQEIARLPKKAKLSPAAWDYLLGTEVVEYARTRGLAVKTLKKFKVGQMERNGKSFMTMPVFEDHELVAIKYRCTSEKVFFTEKGSRAALLNFDAVNYTMEPVLILKGEIPVYLCDQHGFLACAFTGGEGYLGAEYFPNLSFAARRVVVGDNDKTGWETAPKRAHALHAEVKFPPEEYKDIDQWILADPDAIPTIKGWLHD
jgi:hypothetical protein